MKVPAWEVRDGAGNWNTRTHSGIPRTSQGDHGREGKPYGRL